MKILDALEAGRAHGGGRSMGGGPARLLVPDHPERLRPVTFIGAQPLGIGAQPLGGGTPPACPGSPRL
ncbi:hypothetical protein AB0J21_23175 [Streptomyces sp. NPDC049954]|uniref:hypothetical protein n=1 Tax=Streptomyces sp. NPDC049954 TaxID=3155779 RepID=UPI0034310487